MARTITVGLDGSSESRAAAEWAAREATLRQVPVRLIHVWQPVPEPLTQAPLLGAAKVPVVLVRAGEQAADEHMKDPAGIPSAATGFRPVVLGLDTGNPDGTVLSFAFDEARRRESTLTVVAGWNLPPSYVYSLAAGVDPREEMSRERAAALTEVLRPWREKYPDVEVTEASRLGSPANHLIDAARDASLVVVGRRVRRSPVGIHIGAVTHAVMHHATAPVAVVAHD